MASTIPVIPPVTTSTATAGATTPKFSVPSPVSPSNVVGGSTNIRQGIASTQKKAQDLSSTITNQQKQNTLAPTPTAPGYSAANLAAVAALNKTAPVASTTAAATPAASINYPRNSSTGYPVYGTGATGIPGVTADANGNYQTTDASGKPVTIDPSGNVVNMSSTTTTPTTPGTTASPTANDGTVASVLSAAQAAIAALSNSSSPEAQAAAAALTQAQTNLQNAQQGNYTSAEQDQINQAAQAVMAQYQPLIDAAQQEKDQGVPKAIVQAGEAGGLLNTQYAGRSAVTASNAGFIGAGGQLEVIKSAYDNNIQQITSQRDAAVSQAKAAAEQAIRTGDQQDFSNAQTLYQNAVQTYQQNLANINQTFSTAFQAAQIPGTLAAQGANTQATQLNTATGLAAGVIKVDPSTGMPTQPTPDQIQQFATANNIPLATAQAAINSAFQTQLSSAQKGQPAVVKEYESYAAQETAAGRTPLSQLDYIEQKKGGTLSPEDAQLYAQQFLTTGTLPALGNGSANMRSQILTAAAQLARDQGLTGQSLALNKAAYTANTNALKTVQSQADLVNTAESTAGKNLDLASSLGAKVDRSGSPVLNRYVLYLQGQYAGDSDVIAFQNAVQTAANEYAKVVTGQTTGQAVTDAARSEGQKLIDAATSQATFEKVLNVAKQEMSNRASSYADQLSDIQDRIDLTSSDSSTNSSGDSGDILSSPLNSWAAATQ